MGSAWYTEPDAAIIFVIDLVCVVVLALIISFKPSCLGKIKSRYGAIIFIAVYLVLMTYILAFCTNMASETSHAMVFIMIPLISLVTISVLLCLVYKKQEMTSSAPT